MPGPKSYRVANPREIPAGIRILAMEDREWFEGDEITPKDLPDFEEMVAQGYIVGDSGAPRPAAPVMVEGPEVTEEETVDG